MALPHSTLVLGGASSGKSAIAEDLVLRMTDQPVYIATAQAFDAEMVDKVARHQDRRSAAWTTIEAPFDVCAALDGASGEQVVLLDCATLWLTNLILDDRDIADESKQLLAAIARCACPVVVVSNEVGQGIVPDNALSRRFRNEQGQLNQAMAAQMDVVVAVMAGLPLALKGTLP
ncbi:bifunctional adenosylcobinamide kinase/adenosylcobinamide-phosphate guanylyltransferase [Yoonia sp. SS1-5]|uniref:Bifunctional adenosylcobalamin biosynthesis protein n=1 Tax=Yoonia rhodophyticola TaxID=3137370 RepID=A0AAN0NKH1_9RHOB